MQQVSGILDVAIGLVFLYLLLSLICTALTEAAEGFLKLRGKMLCEGLFELFGGLTDSKSATFLNSFYNNPIIYGLYKGDITIEPVKNNAGQQTNINVSKNLPSYIAPNSFALALLNQIAGNTPMTLDSLKRQITQSPLIPDGVKASLFTLIDTADGKLENAISNIENWYTSMGDRVGGWYKRHAQFVTFGMALVIALAGNVDTITIAKTLMTNSTLREQISKLAERYIQSESAKTTDNIKSTLALESEVAQNKKTQEDIKKQLDELKKQNVEKQSQQTQSEPTNPSDNLKTTQDLESELTQSKKVEDDKQKQLYEVKSKIIKEQTQQLLDLADLGLPIGWRNTADQRILPPCGLLPWLEKIFGWFITTLAVSLGAPFWFDILNKVMNFRASIKPKSENKVKASG